MTLCAHRQEQTNWVSNCGLMLEWKKSGVYLVETVADTAELWGKFAWWTNDGLKKALSDLQQVPLVLFEVLTLFQSDDKKTNKKNSVLLVFQFLWPYRNSGQHLADTCIQHIVCVFLFEAVPVTKLWQTGKKPVYGSTKFVTYEKKFASDLQRKLLLVHAIILLPLKFLQHLLPRPFLKRH